jgi:diguanylate cyclase (GGDEF)-like protein
MKNFLEKVSIFCDCSGDEIEEIGHLLAKKTVAQDQILFQEGDQGREFFIVKSGCIRSTIRTTDGSEKEIARFNAGDFFGEMSIVDDAPRSATCTAAQPGVLYTMQGNDFYKLMEASPCAAIRIMYKMLGTTTQRLKTTSLFVADMVRWGNEASRRAITDEVTGAYNRRYLDRVISDCWSVARVSGKVFSLIMMDLDYFRTINEAHGHDVGNRLLRCVVEAMKRSLKPGDILSRYGGDEFSILLPETPLEKAGRIAERIRKAVETLRVEIEGLKEPLAVTTSQGIAGFPESAADLDVIKKMADRALYRAKEEGRNRVVIAAAEE